MDTQPYHLPRERHETRYPKITPMAERVAVHLGLQAKLHELVARDARAQLQEDYLSSRELRDIRPYQKVIEHEREAVLCRQLQRVLRGDLG